MKIEIYNKAYDKAMALRKKVFIEEQGFSYDKDKTDDMAYHIVLFDGDEVIGTCRVFEGEEKDVYVLGRLAVEKNSRGKGCGGVIVKKAIEYIKERNGKTLILHSQLSAKDFYKKQGFEEFGEIDFEEKCPHIWMKYEI